MSPFDIAKLSMGAAGAAALVALLAACGSNSSSAGSASTPSQGTPTVSGASSLKTMSTPIGTVLVDPSGRTVYELVGDTASNQTCNAGCLALWPAVMAGGSQVVVNGHPAFTYAGDSAAGQTK